MIVKNRLAATIDGVRPHTAIEGKPMLPPVNRRALALCALLVATTITSAEQPAAPAKYAPSPEELRLAYQRAGRAGAPRGNVHKAQITPNWFHDNTRFWYHNELRGGTGEF